MKTYRLCEECLDWVLPDIGNCPHCNSVLVEGTVDRQADPLRDVLGELAPIIDGSPRLGEFRLRRKGLPQPGMMYVTTRGLLFLPHHDEHYPGWVERKSPGATLLWALASLVWAPLMFIKLFVSNKRYERGEVRIPTPKYLAPGDRDELHVYLRHRIGTLFVPQSEIHQLSYRRHSWVIERTSGRTLKFAAENDKTGGLERAGWLFRHPDWLHLQP